MSPIIALGYEYTRGPIIVRGKVMPGITGCTRYKEDVCFITAHDAATGKELWRTSTVARPGEPGGDTWGDLPLHVPRRQRRVDSRQLRSGRESGLLGHGAGEAVGACGSRHRRRALYTNSTLALDPDTGQMKWYYQHIPGETQDMDEVFENILIDIGGRQSLFKMGKLGDSLAARSEDRQVHPARPISAIRTSWTSIQYTARSPIDPGMIPQLGVRDRFVSEHCRLQELARDGVHPQTQRVLHSAESQLREGNVRPAREDRRRGGTGPVRRNNTIHPESDGNLGEFLAMDVTAGKMLWRQRTRRPSTPPRSRRRAAWCSSATGIGTSTSYDTQRAASLADGDCRRRLRGFRSRYSVRGRQYVAVAGWLRRRELDVADSDRADA